MRVLFAVLYVVASTCAVGQVEREQATQNLQRMVAADYFSDGAQLQLVEAVEAKRLDSVRQAIEDGANVDSPGRNGVTPLLWTLLKQDYDGFLMLLGMGANPNYVTTVVLDPSTNESAIHSAAMLEDPRFLEALLDYGGDPDLVMEQRNLYSPLFTAVLHRRQENVRLLLDAGANIDHRTLSERTALMYAVSLDAYEMALLLLDYGADVTAKNRWGSDVARLVDQFGGLTIDRDSDEHDSYLLFVSRLRGLGLLE